MIIMAISSNYWQLLSQRASGKNENDNIMALDK